VIEGGVFSRWFWRKPGTEGRIESTQGFATREECEDDAARHGYFKDPVETSAPDILDVIFNGRQKS